MNDVSENTLWIYGKKGLLQKGWRSHQKVSLGTSRDQDTHDQLHKDLIELLWQLYGRQVSSWFCMLISAYLDYMYVWIWISKYCIWNYCCIVCLNHESLNIWWLKIDAICAQKEEKWRKINYKASARALSIWNMKVWIFDEHCIVYQMFSRWLVAPLAAMSIRGSVCLLPLFLINYSYTKWY
jgi:hypothetical protein